MRQTISNRLTVVFSILFVSLLGLIFGFTYYRVFDQFITTQHKELQDWSQYLREQYKSHPGSLLSAENISNQNTALAVHGISMDIILIQGEKTYSIYQSRDITNSIKSRINTVLVMQGFPQESYTRYPGEERIEFVHGQHLKTGSVSAMLFLLKNATFEYIAFRGTIQRLLVFFFVIMVLGGMLGLSLIQKVFSPVKNLVATAREYSGGNLQARVYLEGNDEYRILADSFNDISEKNQILIQEMSREKAELNAIISSLQEALCLIDGDERVVFSNPAFQDWIGKKDVEGSYYWELIRDQELDKLIGRVMQQKKPLQDELELLGKIVVFSAQYVAYSHRVLVVFNDISEFKRAQLIKKDLISSVSHELKTPLTSIKGFVETLRQSENMRGEEDRYLQIIERNTNRLTRIVQDLLLLSNLEEPGQEVELEKVNCKDLVLRMIQLFQQRFEEKDLYLDVELEDDLTIVSDVYKLEQVFINLIDNSYKYTETGGLSIIAAREKDCVVIQLKDTGIGIPQHQQNRIFERFYVVDKSRSRRQGGTGLGLSIVRHILELLQGEIEMHSVLHEGTTFTLHLPLSIKR